MEPFVVGTRKPLNPVPMIERELVPVINGTEYAPEDILNVGSGLFETLPERKPPV